MSANPDLKPLAGLFGKIITGKNIGEVILGKIINIGGFGVVYHGRRLYPAGPRSTHSARNKTQFAVKVTQHCDALLYHEAEHQWTVSGHPNVVSLYDVVEQTENFPGGKSIPLVFMILDLLEGGDLFDALAEIDGRSNIFWRNDELIRSVFIQLLDGIIYCHNKGVFHRDIKLENVLLSKDLTRVCISDFGLATNERMSSRHKMGSVNWLAPECHDQSQSYFPPLSDIWALGILLICLLTNGILPWDTTECARPAGRKIVSSPTSGRTKRTPASISPELALDKHYSAFLASPTYFMDEYDISPRANALLRRMLRPEPFHRIPLALVRKEILELDTFFGQVSEREVREMEMEMEPEYDTKVFSETKQRREKKEKKPDRKRSPTPSFPTFAARLEEQQRPQKSHQHRSKVAIVSSKLSPPSSSSQSSAPPITPRSPIPLPSTDVSVFSLGSDFEEVGKEKEKKKKKKKAISQPLPPAPTRAASRQVSPPLTGTSPTSIVMIRNVPPGAAAPTLSLTPPPPPPPPPSAHCRGPAAGSLSLPTKVGYITSTNPAGDKKYNYRQHHKQYRQPRGTMGKIIAASLAAPAPAAPQYSVVETTVTRSMASALAAPTLSPIAARSPPRATHLQRPQPLYIPSSLSSSLPPTHPAAAAASTAVAYPSIPRSPPRDALSNLKAWFVRKRPVENLAQA